MHLGYSGERQPDCNSSIDEASSWSADPLRERPRTTQWFALENMLQG